MASDLDQLVIDKGNDKIFSISLAEGEGICKNTVTLQVTFGPEYPSHAPPNYSIKHSTLRSNEVERLSSSLDQIYLDNMGESIVYHWLDKIKEVLYDKVTMASEITNPSVENDVDEDGVEEHVLEEPSYVQSDFQFLPEKTKPVKEVSLPPIHHGEFVRDRKSVFQGHLAPVTDKKQVDLVMDKLKENKKIAAATHNIIAYRIDCKNGGFVTGCYDDGETHASSRMLHLLDIVDARNVLVVVTRWYGGVHLGPDRFKHINNCTRELLEAHGYISEKPNSKHGSKKDSSDSSSTKAKNKRH